IESPKVSRINAGNTRICQPGAKEYQNMSTASIPTVMAKSTILVTTAPVGISSRGKYTFEIKLALPMRLLDDSVRAVEKNCHGSSAVYTSKTSGTSDAVIFVMRRNATKTAIVKAGRMSAHATPRAVCLYLTRISR